jgi:hypothetical protein
MKNSSYNGFEEYFTIEKVPVHYNLKCGYILNYPRYSFNSSITWVTFLWTYNLDQYTQKNKNITISPDVRF